MSDFFSRKQSQNTKQMEYCELFETKSFDGERLKLQKTGRLFALTGKRRESNQNEEISPLDGERRQICKVVR